MTEGVKLAQHKAGTSLYKSSVLLSFPRKREWQSEKNIQITLHNIIVLPVNRDYKPANTLSKFIQNLHRWFFSTVYFTNIILVKN